MDNEQKKRLLIQKSGFFKNFDKGIIDGIIPLMSESRFKRDNMICAKGDDSDCLYIINEGQVEISVSSKDGRIIVLGIMSAGDVFGEIGLLDKGSRTADVTAKSDVSLFQLSGRDFAKMAEKFSLKEWASVTSYVCALFRHVTNNLQEATFLDTDVRVLRKLLDIYEKSPEAQKGNGAFELNISQELLGRMVGLSREATNKTLSRLDETGLIEKKYKLIVVPDIEKLRIKVEKEKV